MRVHAIACGLPFFQKSEGKQTILSIVLRIAAIVTGILIIIIGAILGALIISGTFGLGHLSSLYAWSILPVGIVLVVAGISIKYIQKQVSDAPVSLDIPTHQNLPRHQEFEAFQHQQRQKIEEELNTKLDLETKRQEEIDLYEKTNKEKEKEYQEALAKLGQQEFADPEVGKLFKEEEIAFLTDQYESAKKFREDSLKRYLASLESTHENAKQLAKILSGD